MCTVFHTNIHLLHTLECKLLQMNVDYLAGIESPSHRLTSFASAKDSQTTLSLCSVYFSALFVFACRFSPRLTWLQKIKQKFRQYFFGFHFTQDKCTIKSSRHFEATVVRLLSQCIWSDSMKIFQKIITIIILSVCVRFYKLLYKSYYVGNALGMVLQRNME